MNEIFLQLGIGFVGGLFGGVLVALLIRPKEKETIVVTGSDNETQPQSEPTTSQPVPGGLGLPPEVPPPAVPPKPSLSKKERQQKQLELVTVFPELAIVTNNLGEFKRLLELDNIPVPETIDPSAILTARRVGDMVYKHQEILIGTKETPQNKIFAAIITLLAKQ